MITAIAFGQSNENSTLSHPATIARLNAILRRVAEAYEDDPGVSDLDDEQPVHPVKGLTLGDVRLARRLVR